MKPFLKDQLRIIISFLAKRTIRRFKPLIIGVTGSVGKTSTKEAIYTVLHGQKRVRRSRGNWNNEFGLPLTILGDFQLIGGVYFWFMVLLGSTLRLLMPRNISSKLFGGYPEVLILEYAADHPGDLKKLTAIAKPHIGVITAIGDLPVHVEAYDSVEAVTREKAHLIEVLPSSGWAILNNDEPRVLALKERTRANILRFGFSEGATVGVSSFETKLESAGRGIPKKPSGITFKLEHQGSIVPVRIGGAIGKVHAYAAAAAACVGLALNMNLVRIAEELQFYHGPQQRSKLLAGLNGSCILDDSYNAAPLSMRAAITTISELKAKRRVGILGDMRELGRFSEQAHREIGSFAGSVFNVLVFVGEKRGILAAAAKEAGMKAKDIYEFETAQEALPKVVRLIKRGDLVLIKASHSLDLAKIAEAIQAGRVVK